MSVIILNLTALWGLSNYLPALWGLGVKRVYLQTYVSDIFFGQEWTDHRLRLPSNMSRNINWYFISEKTHSICSLNSFHQLIEILVVTSVGNINCCPLSGSIRFGDLTHTLRTPRRWLFRRWRFQIIMSGSTGQRKYSTWSSKLEKVKYIS